MSKYNTIKLAAYGMPPVEIERVAKLPIKPGMLCHLDTDGTIIPETAISGVSGTSPKLVAMENSFLGNGITDDWNDASQDYQSGDLVTCYHVRPGDKIWGWIGTGAAANAEIGNQLHAWGASSGFDGSLLVDVDSPIGFVGAANENIDNTAGVIPVRIEVIIT